MSLLTRNTNTMVDVVKIRRGQGTGSVTEARPGVWRLRVYLGRDPVTGTPRQAMRTVKLGTGSKRKAEAALREFITEVENGSRGGSSATLSYLLKDWIAHRSSDWAPRTTHEARRLADKVIAPRAIGAVKLRELTAKHLDDLYRDLGADGLKASSVRRCHAVISSALSYAVDWEWLKSNPAARAHPPRLDDDEPTAPAPEQVRAMIETAEADDPAYGLLLYLAALTGMRRGELCALRWSDIDLADAVVTVRHSIYRAGPIRGEKTTKGRRVRRMALDPATVLVLSHWREAMAARAVEAGTRIDEDSYVVSRWPACEHPLNPDTLSSYARRLCDRLELADVHLHSLRHFSASQLIGAGVDVATVAARLGHADPATTLRIYSHALRDRDRAAAAVLAKALGPGG